MMRLDSIEPGKSSLLPLLDVMGRLMIAEVMRRSKPFLEQGRCRRDSREVLGGGGLAGTNEFRECL
jgi:hypothetical protein